MKQVGRASHAWSIDPQQQQTWLTSMQVDLVLSDRFQAWLLERGTLPDFARLYSRDRYDVRSMIDPLYRLSSSSSSSSSSLRSLYFAHRPYVLHCPLDCHHCTAAAGKQRVGGAWCLIFCNSQTHLTFRFVSEWSEAGRKPAACSWDDRPAVVVSRQLVSSLVSRKNKWNRQTKTAAASSVQHYLMHQ